MKKIAIVGSGISGISAAYYLNNSFDVHVYEKADYVGGHTNTVEVSEGGASYDVDTAFMVFNRDNYYNLTRMFDELGVTTLTHEGGYNFFDLGTGICYGTEELSLSEDEVVGRYPESFVRIWRQANRFFKEASRHFFEGKAYVPLREYFEAYGYSDDFIESFVVQLGSACWTLPTDKMGEMPASTLIGFFMNHGQGGLGGKKVSWETVENGSKQYLDRIQAALRNPVQLNTEVQAVYPSDDKVAVVIDGQERLFDKVLIATHADQALRLLEIPTELQCQVLSKVRYNRSEVVLHTDTSVLPAERERWACWNYGCVTREGAAYPYLVYYMNEIHGFTANRDYLVSIDSPLPLDEGKVIERMIMEHPIIDMAVYRAQDELYALNGEGNIFFSGTYFSIKRAGPDFAGFHESGISSALEAVKCIKKQEGVQ